MSAAERIPQIERAAGSGRQPAHVEELRDAQLELRVARHEVLAAGNEMRQLGRSVQLAALQGEGNSQCYQLGVEVEARGNRLIRQWEERR